MKVLASSVKWLLLVFVKNKSARWFFIIKILLAVGASPALARCYLDGSSSNSWSGAITFNDADYVRDTAVGTATTKYSLATWSSMACDWSNYSVKSVATIIGGELVPGYTNVYKTGVEGIGIKFFGVIYGASNTREAPFSESLPSPGPQFYSHSTQQRG
ncbi:hypothetical protein PUP75_18530 [Pseudomonas chlororaphis]|uniref:hypothetical protein n=1 Tax=Pseudomonas chlororaphis TaxID=587753 RepID=UPI002367C73A|nr:hypothetical protein [Pseudomonas chlororaphis]WDH50945.1 hypothetical protein PUP75_18530 [Pseudomonas chlororaphis]